VYYFFCYRDDCTFLSNKNRDDLLETEEVSIMDSQKLYDTKIIEEKEENKKEKFIDIVKVKNEFFMEFKNRIQSIIDLKNSITYKNNVGNFFLVIGVNSDFANVPKPSREVQGFYCSRLKSDIFSKNIQFAYENDKLTHFSYVFGICLFQTLVAGQGISAVASCLEEKGLKKFQQSIYNAKIFANYLDKINDKEKSKIVTELENFFSGNIFGIYLKADNKECILGLKKILNGYNFYSTIHFNNRNFRANVFLTIGKNKSIGLIGNILSFISYLFLFNGAKPQIETIIDFGKMAKFFQFFGIHNFMKKILSINLVIKILEISEIKVVFTLKIEYFAILIKIGSRGFSFSFICVKNGEIWNILSKYLRNTDSLIKSETKI